jgi:hypothetical protein
MGHWIRIFAVAMIVAGNISAEATGDYAFKLGYPSPETVRKAYDDADYQRAVTAYRFWYPSVSVEGIFNGSRNVGLKDGKDFSIGAANPRQVGFTLNSDTPYGSGVFDLSHGPLVIEFPPGAYIGLVNDHYQGWVMDLGIPGPDAGKGGKHLVLPPGYKSEIPQGYYVGRSLSNKVLLAVRALPQKGDQKAALEALRAIKVYPLFKSSQAESLDFVDTTEKDMDSTSLKWEDNLQFWEKLHAIVDSEPLVEKFLPMYGLLSALGIEKGKPFNPDARMKKILEQAAKDGLAQMLVAGFASNRADRIAWQDRKWEWAGLVPGSAQFETDTGIDLEARDRWFVQAIVTSPAMFRRSAGAGSLYWLGVRDSNGAWLDGGKTYRLRVPQPVPGKLFWSVTVYDTQTRSQVQTDQNKAALRSMFELKDVDITQPTDLYFGPEAPAGKENRWIKTTPGRGWFTYFRIYGPEGPAFNGSWKPGDFEELR